MKTPILGSSYVARSVHAADSRMVNLFPEIVPEGGKEPAFLNRAPGLQLLNTIGTGPIRGLYQFADHGYVISGVEAFELNSDWSYVKIGDVTGTTPVSMSDNGTQLFIACNGLSYVYNKDTRDFAAISDGDFAGAVSVGYIDGYFVYNEPNSQRIWVTSFLDALSIDPLDFASAEGSPDNVVSLIVDHREVWVFGTNSVETWYNAGNLDFPLQRIQGAYNEIGCEAPYSVAKLNNAIFWLGSDARGRGIVYQTKGYTGVRVSTHAVEWQIQQYSSLSDAIGYTYQQDGHSFYVLIFPTANTTWVYDTATEVWHERAGFENGQFTRHRSNCQMSYANKIVVGDYQNGNIYAFNLDIYADNGQIQKWLRSWRALPTGANDLKRTAQHSLQLDCDTGVGTNGVDPFDPLSYLSTESDQPLLTESGNKILATVETTTAVNPRAMLRWSDDGGHTWSNEHWTSVGRIGAYGHRAIWRRLGMTLKIRDRVYEVSGTDPVKIVVTGAELLMSPTNA